MAARHEHRPRAGDQREHVVLGPLDALAAQEAVGDEGRDDRARTRRAPGTSTAKPSTSIESRDRRERPVACDVVPQARATRRARRPPMPPVAERVDSRSGSCRDDERRDDEQQRASRRAGSARGGSPCSRRAAMAKVAAASSASRLTVRRLTSRSPVPVGVRRRARCGGTSGGATCSTWSTSAVDRRA